MLRTRGYILLLVILCSVVGDEVPGSLTFVIDDTISMREEIEGVKSRTYDIFEAVWMSNASQIDEFTIVTFNDPDVYFAITTTSADEFYSALQDIVPHNGEDCPEMAMKGIEVAISSSKPNSFLYVYTDASAKDYYEYENVKSMAQKKTIQINFLLTGECQKNKVEEHLVYDHLAAATLGQVFHIEKDEISRIIDYIIANLRNKRIILLRKTFKNYGKCVFPFTVDSKVWEILIALSSAKYLTYNDLKVYGPNNKEIWIEELITSMNTAIVKMQGDPGEYTIVIEQCHEVTVLVSAATSVSFKHGFSSISPSSLAETDPKPLSGKESYLAIALINKERDVTLKTADIRAMDDTLIKQLALTLIDDIKQLYVTEAFTPPQDAFTIAVTGYTKSNEKITRISQTSTETYKPYEKPENKPLDVSVIGPKEVSITYQNSVTLKCKVFGYPEPVIRWENEFQSNIHGKVTEIAPGDYISTVHLNKLTNDVKFICKAKSPFEEKSDFVNVIVEKPFLNVLEYPKDVAVEYGKSVELQLKIDAMPLATINWYQNDKEIVNNDHFQISLDKSVLTIKNIQPEFKGKYSVKAFNVGNNVEYIFQVDVTGTAKPEKVPLEVTIIGPKEVHIKYQKSVELKCKVLGSPQPVISWENEFQSNIHGKVTEIAPGDYISTIHLNKLTNDVKFICKAKSPFEEKSDFVNVIVEKPFLNVLEYPKDVAVEYGKSVELQLKVDAMPLATINWYQNDKEIVNDDHFQISLDKSVLTIKNIQPEFKGKYSVKAFNVGNNVEYIFQVDVTGTAKPEKVPLEVTIIGPKEVQIKYQKSVELKCKVLGSPQPVISWENEFQSNVLGKINEIKPGEYISTVQLRKLTKDVKLICKAKNPFEEKADYVNVLVEKSFLNVLDYPKDVAVEYGKSVELQLKVDATPPATINWYQNDKDIVNNDHFQISLDKSILTIKNIQPAFKGKYAVKAFNVDNNVEYKFEVDVMGTEIPIIDKHIKSHTKGKGSSLDIECRIVQGKPQPEISWSFIDPLGIITSLKETGEVVHFKSVTQNNVGTYKCHAANIVGTDDHVIQLYIEYPPKIKIEPSKMIEIKNGDLVHLTCFVDGLPIPSVRWLANGKEIYDGRKYKIFQNHHLSFTGSLFDSGDYTCEASNYLKTVSAKVPVFVYEPTTIIRPKESEFEVNLRSKLLLSCDASGYPKPTVQWLHYSALQKTPKKIKSDANNNVILDNIQFEDGGYYKCTADNTIDTDEFTYTVNVRVPAVINPTSVTNKLHVVKGDLSFTLTCNATGSPKPTITWRHDGIPIRNDRWFQISHDGTLKVNRVVSKHEGTYTCRADNKFNSDVINYEVNVHEYPPYVERVSIIAIKAGKKRRTMFCGMILRDDFLVRWFKDGVFIKEGSLILTDVSKAHAGFYTCRLSTPKDSFSFNKKVIVGSEPIFITTGNPTVDFIDGAKATFDCSATGDPPPRTKWWYDDNNLNVDTSKYTFTMTLDNIGKYMCKVSNEFGTIEQKFDIVAGECMMSLENDFTAQHPLLMYGKRQRRWPLFEISSGNLRMQKYRTYRLFCPNSFIIYDNKNFGTNTVTSCIGDSLFKLGGQAVKAANIKCDKPILPLSRSMKDDTCLGRNTRLFNVGFDVDSFVSVYSVCFNETANTPLFVRHVMHKSIANTIPKHVMEFTRGTLFKIEFDDIYDCQNQVDVISSFIGKATSVDKNCCFKRRQLVNPRDLIPGLPQVASYHYINIAPQWNYCGTQNWDEVERRVRQYVMSSNKRFTIWTGAAYSVIKDLPVILKDKFNQELQVPQYIYKVFHDQFAVIHINVPGLTTLQVSRYRLCNDICDSVDWMVNSEWHDVNKGFIYCCTFKEFERIFDYQDVFIVDNPS